MGSSKKSKGGIVVEWAKHFRPWMARLHWKKVRAKEKRDIRREQDE